MTSFDLKGHEIIIILSFLAFHLCLVYLLQVNGEFTAGENIGDAGGIKVAFKVTILTYFSNSNYY